MQVTSATSGNNIVNNSNSSGVMFGTPDPLCTSLRGPGGVCFATGTDNANNSRCYAGNLFMYESRSGISTQNARAALTASALTHGGTYYIVPSSSTGYCLECAGGGTATDTNVQLGTRSSASYQK